MFFIPEYIKEKKSDGALHLISLLLKNEVSLVEPYIKEYNEIRKKGCSELNSELKVFLHEQEMLVSPDEVKGLIEQLKESLDNRLLLTIMPTEACNFNCIYCYETHKNVRMKNEITETIVDYLSNNVQKYKVVGISWFGGEPTLAKDIVLYVSNKLMDLQRKYGFRNVSTMTTNGYLLDVESFKEYYYSGINSYQITLDGFNHDLTRPLANGGNSYQRIVQNLKDISMLPQNEFAFEIILRRNVMLNDEDLSWYDLIYEMFGKDPRFKVIPFPVTDWGGEAIQQIKPVPKCESLPLMYKHEAYIAKLEMGKKNRDDLFSGICYSSCKNGYIIRPDGRIEKCTIALDDPANLVGFVDVGKGFIIDEEANLKWCRSEIKTECLSCQNILSCMNLSCRKEVVLNGAVDGFCEQMELKKLENEEGKALI